MSWAILGAATLAAGSVYAKDKVADWTEGTFAEPYTSQWDNPEWYDYTIAGVSAGVGAAGGPGQAIGKAGNFAVNTAEGVDAEKKAKKNPNIFDNKIEFGQKPVYDESFKFESTEEIEKPEPEYRQPFQMPENPTYDVPYWGGPRWG